MFNGQVMTVGGVNPLGQDAVNELSFLFLVRVSGYSACFNDLTPEMQDEIIRRSNLGVSAQHS